MFLLYLPSGITTECMHALPFAEPGILQAYTGAQRIIIT